MPESGAPNWKLIRVLLIIGIVSLSLAMFAAIQIGRANSFRFNGTPYPDSPPAPGFSLIDHTGERVELTDLRGRSVLLFFGFTECPDVCPLSLAKLDRLVRENGISQDDLAILLISVDPATDTPQRLAQFVQSIGPTITGLTGTREEIDAVLGQYGAYAQPSTDHEGRPMIAHTSLVFGIDRIGNLRVLIHAEDPDEVVVEDIRTLLRIDA